MAPTSTPTVSAPPVPSSPTTQPSTPTPTASPTLAPTPSSTSPIPIILPGGYSRQELVDYALGLINSDRQANGLENVSLSNVGSAQSHADEMLLNNYFSHWDLNGYKPHMRYTLAGGAGAVDENIAWNYNSLTIDAKKAINRMEFDMMNNDAGSNWGHRYNILTPFHNKVAIGVAVDGNNVYFVEDFENDYVSWTTFTATGGNVNMAGTIQKSGLTIQQVVIFYDNPTSLTTQQLANAPYNGPYDSGTFVGMAFPRGRQSQEGITIAASTWSQKGQNFQINFDLTQAFKANGNGVYTLFLQTNLANTSTQENSLTSYSVWYSG